MRGPFWSRSLKFEGMCMCVAVRTAYITLGKYAEENLILLNGILSVRLNSEVQSTFSE